MGDPDMRRVTLSAPVITQTATTSVWKQVYINLGTLCAKGFFDYTEYEFGNSIQIHADIVGYQSPLVSWTINGQNVSFLGGTLEVPATWDNPPASPFNPIILRSPTAALETTRMSANAADISIDVALGQGNVDLEILCHVMESSDSGSNGATNSKAAPSFSVVNQKLAWAQAYSDAVLNCQRVRHLAAGPTATPVGDEFDVAQALRQLVASSGSPDGEELLRAAELIRSYSRELAEALTSQAEAPK